MGNTRVRFVDKDKNGEIEPDTTSIAANELTASYHYYPFGMRMEGDWDVDQGTAFDYQYNGKELEEDLGLGWYGYGARWYDPSVARWAQVDPLADWAPNWTPYRYGFSNPLIYMDPTGMFESRKEARRYKKDHKLKGSVRKQGDGSFGIENKKEKSVISDLGDNLGVLKGSLIGSRDVVESTVEEGRYAINLLRDGTFEEIDLLIDGNAPDVGPSRGYKGLKLLAGGAKSSRALLKAAQLPTRGRIRFVPRKADVQHGTLLRRNGGYVDRFGNVWKKGPTRTQGEAWEWDVLLSKRGKRKLWWLTRKGKRNHINVSLDGKVTH